MVHANGLYFLPYLADVTDNFVSFVCFFCFWHAFSFRRNRRGEDAERFCHLTSK